ncbi:MAG: hypothetical protein FJ144_10405 [Deltaproteobacteria bacterium]|nr:hypothetical protein [Deltaproteobacteria bacterium]
MRPRRRRAVIVLGTALAMLGGCERPPSGIVGNPKVVVLAFDGIDPRLVERFRAQGSLRNLDELARSGASRILGTTEPPECAVAWSSLATGLPPAEHGIFAPVRRDPATYALEDATVELAEPELVLGVPLRDARATSLRRGQTFWEVADGHAVRSVVLRAPFSLPPGELEHGRVLAGAGVPDARLSARGFRLLTTGAPPARLSAGEVDRVVWDGQVVRASLPGLVVEDRRGADLPLTLTRAGERLRVELEDGWVLLKPREWSEWMPVTFSVSAFFSVRATLRFYLDALSPELVLYVSPPNLDPHEPLVTIGWPPSFPGELASRVGLFGTRVVVGPSEAYVAGALDEKGFVDDLTDSLGWARRATLHQIDQRDAELVVSFFTETDRVSHMFLRELEESGERRKREADLVEHSYRAMDRIVGDVRRHLPPATRLLVVSDHGFHAFRRALDVDAWLASEGLLARDGETTDWSKTRAYAVGDGAIDLNLAGREAQGIVSPGEEASRLLTLLEERLRSLRDPRSGEAPVAEVRRGATLFAGPFAERAPDLLVSFRPGYRTTFATSLGPPDAQGFVDNDSRWSGDHGAQPASVTPGVLFSSVPLRDGAASLLDVAPTVLGWLGAPVPSDLAGRSLDASGPSTPPTE